MQEAKSVGETKWTVRYTIATSTRYFRTKQFW